MLVHDLQFWAIIGIPIAVMVALGGSIIMVVTLRREHLGMETNYDFLAERDARDAIHLEEYLKTLPSGISQM